MSDQKTRQGAVTGTDRAAYRHGFVLGPPGTFSANKHRAFPAQGGQHIPDALIHQVPGGAGGQFGAGLKLTPVIGSRQLRQLLRIRLNQGGFMLPARGGDKRGLRSINRDIAGKPGRTQLTHQLGIIGGVQPRRQ